jgi:hypothetical protein
MFLGKVEVYHSEKKILRLWACLGSVFLGQCPGHILKAIKNPAQSAPGEYAASIG